jgi:hypothetical protein
VALSWVDQQHLAYPDLSLILSVVEMQVALGHYQRNRDRVAVLRNVLTRLQPQSDHTHRSTVGDLLEADCTTRSFGTLR